MPIRNIFLIALAVIVSMTCYTTATRSRYARLFAEAVSTIEREALQKVPQSDLFASAMQGMASRLDGHSRFISGEDFRVFDEDLNQQFGGVGMYVDTDPETNVLTVLAPIPDSPAFEAGIQSGDQIVEIAGQPTENLERGDAVKLIRGPQGTEVNVAINRNGQKFSFDLTRRSIHEPSAHGDYRNSDGTWVFRLKEYPRLGYIRLAQFGKQSSEEIAQALSQIDGKVDGLILDLRNNAGGLLDGAIEICDLFLEPGLPIVRTRGRDNVVLEQHISQTDSVWPAEKALFLLVNRNSASASEIVAACLKDHERAILVGEQSWGKGTVQQVIPIEQGKSALKLTTASYWRPSGINIDRYDPTAKETGQWGVVPTEEYRVELSDEQIFQNRRLRSYLDLRGLVEEEDLIRRDTDGVLDTVDEPLQRAIRIINEPDERRIAA